MSLLSNFFIFFIILLFIVLAVAQGEESSNPTCSPFNCGALGRIGFPYSNEMNPECGFYIVADCKEEVQRIKFGENWSWFYVTGISQDNTVTVRENKTLVQPSNSCTMRNLSLPIYSFISVEPIKQLLFNCSGNSTLANFTSDCKEPDYFIGHRNGLSDDVFQRINPYCLPIQLVVSKTQQGVDFFHLYAGSFRLQVNVTSDCRECFQRGGQCKDYNGKFQCSNLETGNRKSWLKLGGLVGITATVIGIWVALAFCIRKKLFSLYNFMVSWSRRTENYQNIKVFLRNYGSLAPKRYSYLDIKKMTNSFKHKLGQGGYGDVYKGRLLDGRNVAVKLLIESKGNGEEFINEVASISRTSHVNIVSLLGFCFEGSRRALIYEFVRNGSLEKFIYKKNPMSRHHQLKWEKLYRIAIGIAQGLEYLHRGCNTRILHLDIKPHNILIDEDFCPEICDFGLAKICPRKESIVSMTGPRGTIGYIAPEVFCRSFGEVSHKSDVYSYGMMVLEMVRGRNNIDVAVDHTSEIYFPHWIYQRLEVDEELGLQGIANEENREYAWKMIIVSLWCIQTNPLDRPTMSRVVDMLEGSLDSLQIPPKPFLSSPRSQAYSSTQLLC